MCKDYIKQLLVREMGMDPWKAGNAARQYKSDPREGEREGWLVEMS